MPVTDLIILSVVAFAFMAFAVVLAWGDYQTQDIARASRERALSGLRVASFKGGAVADRSERKAEAKSRAPAHA